MKIKIKIGKAWTDCYCVCGCGITVRAIDKDAQAKIEAWQEQHAKKCRRKK